jgi:dipeptidyl aminopeptidase/acylaminoacyl peptidase
MITQNVALDVAGLNITGQLYLPAGQAPYPVVGVCHGIPARIPDPTERGYPLLAERICREGLAVFIFNFRGTGTSGGNFDMPGWLADLQAVIDFLWALPEVDRSHLKLLGFSGGAAVSVCVAAQDRRVSAVAACACPAQFNLLSGDNIDSFIERFRSIGIFRDKDFPLSIKKWLDGFNQVSPIDCVADIAPRPLLLVHGDSDEVVDVSHAYRLYQKAGEPRELVLVAGAGHRLRLDEQAMATVIDWLKARCRR